MLRRGPTAITLGESDLLDFKVRSDRRLAEERENRRHKSKNRSTDTHDGPRFNIRAHKQREANRAVTEPFIRPLNMQAATLEDSDAASTVHIEDETEASTLTDPFTNSGERTATLEDIAPHLRAISPSSAGLEGSTASSPPKNDDFHYGGFVESPSDSYTWTTSSSFGRLYLPQ